MRRAVRPPNNFTQADQRASTWTSICMRSPQSRFSSLFAWKIDSPGAGWAYIEEKYETPSWSRSSNRAGTEAGTGLPPARVAAWPECEHGNPQGKYARRPLQIPSTHDTKSSANLGEEGSVTNSLAMAHSHTRGVRPRHQVASHTLTSFSFPFQHTLAQLPSF